MPAGIPDAARAAGSCTLPFACWRAISTPYGLSVNLHPAPVGSLADSCPSGGRNDADERAPKIRCHRSVQQTPERSAEARQRSVSGGRLCPVDQPLGGRRLVELSDGEPQDEDEQVVHRAQLFLASSQERRQHPGLALAAPCPVSRGPERFRCQPRGLGWTEAAAARGEQQLLGPRVHHVPTLTAVPRRRRGSMARYSWSRSSGWPPRGHRPGGGECRPRWQRRR